MTDEEFAQAMSALFADLASRQVPLDADFAEVLSENIEDLYEYDDEASDA